MWNMNLNDNLINVMCYTDVNNENVARYVAFMSIKIYQCILIYSKVVFRNID